MRVGPCAGQRFDAARARCHTLLDDDLECLHLAGVGQVCASAKFPAERAHRYHATGVRVLLAKEHHRTGSAGFGQRYGVPANRLGFLDQGVVDQHFDRKARLGRLVRALAETGQTRGFGIDENTALLVRPDLNSAKVLGRGSVVVLDAREARFDFDSKAMASGLKLSILAPGVRFRLGDFVLLDEQGDATVGNEYFGYQPLQGGGMALANSRLDQALGFDLLDNDSTQRLDRYSIDNSGRIILYRFTQTGDSAGYWQNEGSADRYTVSNVRMDILELKADLPDH